MRALVGLVVVGGLVACGSRLAPTPRAVARPAPVAEASLPAGPPALGPSFASFAPTVRGAELADVDSCGGCHADVFAQQQASAHAFSSFNNPIYRFAVEALRKDVGLPASRMCGGCHDIALLADGALDREVSPDDERAHAGVTCRVCHGIATVTRDGNGSFALTRPPLDLPDSNDPASVERHRQSVKPLATAEMCGSCHRSFLDDSTGNRGVFLAGQDDLTPWMSSPYAKNGLGRIDDKIAPQTCIDCHMPREAAPLGDAAAVHDGKVFSHRFLGGHTWLASMIGNREQLARQAAMLKGVVSIDIAAARAADGTRTLPADGAPVIPGQHLTLDVVLRNLLVGHRFPGGVLDAQDTWIEVEVRDHRGRLLATAGDQQARRGDDPSAHVLRALVADDAGLPHLLRDVHQFRAAVVNHTILPRDADVVRYGLTVPAHLGADALPLAVTARLVHRSRNLPLQRAACAEATSVRGRAFSARAHQLKDLVLDPCADQPLTVIGETRVFLGTGWDREAHGDRPAWSRLYEHGLGLLHSLQEDLDDARPSLERALALIGTDPALGRQRAMVLHALGRLEGREGRTEVALHRFDEAEALVPGAPAIAKARGEALAQVWRWAEAAQVLRLATAKAPGNLAGWQDLAVALGSSGDDGAALAAARSGLALAPRDGDLLRVQALSLRGLGAPPALTAAALAAYESHRSPDRATDIRLACAVRSPQCALERDPVHTHELVPVR